MNTIEYAKKLISIPSTSGKECAIADYIENETRKLTKVNRIGNSIIACVDYGGTNNIALIGHIDVVPTDNNWTHNPFIAHENNGRIYGRGACDMKSGLAIMISTLINICRKEILTKSNLHFIFYDREELGMPNGLTDLYNNAFLDDLDFAIILEPTNSAVNIGCFGDGQYQVNFKGISTHTSQPEKGCNALYNANDFISEFRREVESWLETTIVDGQKLQDIAVATEIANNGNSYNTVPSDVSLSIHGRFFRQERIKGFLSNLSQLAEKHKGIANLQTSCPPGKIVNLNNKFLRALLRTNPLLTKEVVKFWTDIAQLKEWGLDAVNYGPGSVEQAHIADEFVEIKQIKIVEETIAKFINIF